MGIDRKGPRGTLTDLPALLWGLAEATFFFIVPDVLITHRALHGWRPGAIAALHAVAGALIGGALMFWLGTRHPEALRGWLDWVPAVSPEMIASVEAQLATQGLWSLFLGPLSGTPYKLYAALTPQAGLGLGALLLISIPARLLRFLLLAAIAALLGDWLSRHHGPHMARLAWALGWGGFYTAWFALMPN